jgi:hypothetical protein
METATTPHPERVRLYLDASQSESDDTSVEYVRTVAQEEPQTSAPVLQSNPASLPNEQTSNKRKEPQVKSPPAPKRVSKLAHDCKFAWLLPPSGAKHPKPSLVKLGVQHRDELGRKWCITPAKTKKMSVIIVTAPIENFGFLPPHQFISDAGTLASFMIMGVNPGDAADRECNYLAVRYNVRSRYGMVVYAAKHHEVELSNIHNDLVQSRNGWTNYGCRCSICNNNNSSGTS